MSVGMVVFASFDTSIALNDLAPSMIALTLADAQCVFATNWTPVLRGRFKEMFALMFVFFSCMVLFCLL